MRAAIHGITFHLPSRIETNDDLQRQNPEWQMDKIAAKSGILCRHIAAADETASDLGYRAAAALLERKLVPVDEIDFVLYCTQSPDHYLPSSACVLQHRLGLKKHVGAFDFNLGCSGFIYGLQIAKSLVVSGIARNVLLITADTYTKFANPHDRTVRTLFGDGAAATLIGLTDGPGEIGDFVVGTDGSGADRLIVPAGGCRLPRSAQTAIEAVDSAGCVRSPNDLYMDGPALFTFALTTVPKVVSSLMTKTGRSVDDYDWFVYHQANKYMLENLFSRSKIPPQKAAQAYEMIGNTVSSSIPIAIETYVQAGKIVPGQRLMLVGFGVGFSWGACEVTWGNAAVGSVA